MKIIEFSDIEEAYNKYIDEDRPTPDGTSSVVLIFRELGYAYKEYTPDDEDFDPNTMYVHIKNLFDNLYNISYSYELSQLKNISAIPKGFVFDNGTLKGYIMDCIPNECYIDGKKERTLKEFLKYDSSTSDLRELCENLIGAVAIFHSIGYIMGDVLGPNNIIIGLKENIGNRLIYPYFIDMDSCIKPGLCLPNGSVQAYNSLGYEPPEGMDAVATKKSDVYKLCLILLRIFYTKSLNSSCGNMDKDFIHNRAILRYPGKEAIASLINIEKIFNSRLKNLIEKGLSDSPNDRPTIEELENTLEDICNSDGTTGYVNDNFCDDMFDLFNFTYKPDSVSNYQDANSQNIDNNDTDKLNELIKTYWEEERGQSKNNTIPSSQKISQLQKPQKKTTALKLKNFLKYGFLSFIIGIVCIISYLKGSGSDPFKLFGIEDVSFGDTGVYPILKDGGVYQIEANIRPSGYDISDLTFKVASPEAEKIVTVSESGLIKANDYNSEYAYDYVRILASTKTKPKIPIFNKNENTFIDYCIIDNTDSVEPIVGNSGDSGQCIGKMSWENIRECSIFSYIFSLRTKEQISIKNMIIYTRASEDSEWVKLATKEGLYTNSTYAFLGSQGFDCENRVIESIKVEFIIDNNVEYNLWESGGLNQK